MASERKYFESGVVLTSANVWPRRTGSRFVHMLLAIHFGVTGLRIRRQHINPLVLLSPPSAINPSAANTFA